MRVLNPRSLRSAVKAASAFRRSREERAGIAMDGGQRPSAFDGAIDGRVGEEVTGDLGCGFNDLFVGAAAILLLELCSSVR